MPSIYQVADQFRAELLAGERAAAGEMVRAYGQTWQRIRRELELLQREIRDAKARGVPVTPAWLRRQQRLGALLRQVEAELNRFAALADETVRKEQAAAVRAASRHAQQLTLTALDAAPAPIPVQFHRIPTEAMTDLVGFLQDGSPLRELFDELGPESSKAVRERLMTGLATGKGPRAVAREIREDLGENMVRALRIARTETLRSYRTAAIRHYTANEDILEGWVWHARLDRRTCPVCIAMHGKLFPVDTPFGSHPNCRCTPIPRTKGWAALGLEGLPDTRPPIVRGPDWFAKQPADVQRRILGPGKYRAYREKELGLLDLVRYHDDPRWGPTRRERALRDILAA